MDNEIFACFLVLGALSAVLGVWWLLGRLFSRVGRDLERE